MGGLVGLLSPFRNTKRSGHNDVVFVLIDYTGAGLPDSIPLQRWAFKRGLKTPGNKGSMFTQGYDRWPSTRCDSARNASVGQLPSAFGATRFVEWLCTPAERRLPTREGAPGQLFHIGMCATL